MTSINTQIPKFIQYPQRTIKRAERAILCSPFLMQLFTTMRHSSVSLANIAGNAGTENKYTTSPRSEIAVENALLWLIQVGLLRREVDGQGITDSFRLTPLGRQLVEKWEIQGNNFPTPSWRDRLYNTLSRWLNLWRL